MAHFYKKTSEGVRLLKTVDTPAKARKSPGALASVTTILSYMPNQFMKTWREGKIAELAREHWDVDVSKLGDLAWGQCTMPDGSTVSSSEFGTAVHAQLEAATQALMDGADYRNEEWMGYYRPFLRWLAKEDITPTHAELMLACEERRIAGTLDGIGTKAGRVILWDFKCRSGDNVATKTRPKDTMQLAIEAQMIKEQYTLAYIPRIYTIVIDAETGECHPKLWTEKAQAKAYEKFEILRTFVQAWEKL